MLEVARHARAKVNVLLVAGAALTLLAPAAWAQATYQSNIGKIPGQPRTVNLDKLPPYAGAPGFVRPSPPPGGPVTEARRIMRDNAAAEAVLHPPRAPLPSPAITPAASAAQTPAASAAQTPAASAAQTYVAFDGNQQARCGDPGASDMALAVGSTVSTHRVVQVNNNCISLFATDGKMKADYPKYLGNLFKADNKYPFDPRAMYDWVKKRYIIVATEKASAAGKDEGYLWIAVSKGDDPGGDYAVYRIQTPTGATDAFVDFPRLGQDRDTIYIASNKSVAGQYQYEEWLLLPKSELYRGAGDVTYAYVYDIKVDGILTDSSQPANLWNPSDPDPGAGFFVTSKNVWVPKNSPQCPERDKIYVCNGLFVWAVVPNPDPKHPLPLVSAVTVPTGHDYSLPPIVQQGGGFVNAGDNRIAGGVSYGESSLFASLTTKANGTRKAVALLFKIQPALRQIISPDCGSPTCRVIDSAKIVDELPLNYGDDSSFYATTHPDGLGNTLTVFNMAGPNRYISAAFFFRKAGRGATTVVRNGMSAYANERGWGDYTAVAPAIPAKPGDPFPLWFAAEYTQAPTDRIYSYNWFTVVGFSWAQ